jgi:hypothetical protein
LIVGVCLAIGARTASASDFCGEAPPLSDPAISTGVADAVGVFRIWSGSGTSFERLATEKYRELAKGRTARDAQDIAVALLHAECIELTQGRDLGHLPWHIKDRFIGLSKITPDFLEAHALLDRMQAAEARK